MHFAFPIRVALASVPSKKLRKCALHRGCALHRVRVVLEDYCNQDIFLQLVCHFLIEAPEFESRIEKGSALKMFL
jgi:hypothetical protein